MSICFNPPGMRIHRAKQNPSRNCKWVEFYKQHSNEEDIEYPIFSNLARVVIKKVKQSFYSVYSYSGIESIDRALNMVNTNKM